MKIFKRIFVLLLIAMLLVSTDVSALSEDSFKIVLDAGHGAADLGCAKNRACGEDKDGSIRACLHPSNDSLQILF